MKSSAPLPSNPVHLFVALLLATIVSWCVCQKWQTSHSTQTASEYRAFADAGRILESRPEIVITGSSQLWTDVNPANFSALTVNLSHGSNDYTMIRHSLEHALSRADSLRFAIIELGPVPLYSDVIKRNRGLGFAAMGMKRLHWPRPLTVRLRRLIRDQILGPFLDQPRLTPASLLEYQQQSGTASDSVQFKALPAGHFTDNSIHRARFHSNRRRSDRNMENNRKAVDRILDLLQHSSIQSLWVIPPTVETYRKALSTQARDDLKKFRNYLSKHPSVSIIDLAAWNADHLTRNDFFDADHLNVNGAKKLSSHLNQLVNQLREQQGVKR